MPTKPDPNERNQLFTHIVEVFKAMPGVHAESVEDRLDRFEEVAKRVRKVRDEVLD